MSSISFEPLIPASLFAALAALGAVLLAWYVARRPASISRWRWALASGLMICGLALVLVVLLNPTLVREVPPPPGKPVLSVLVDRSLSMATTDSAGGQTRYAAAGKLARALTRELGEQFEVRLMDFAAAVAPLEPDQLPSRTPDGQTTDLSAAIAGSLAQERPQGQAIVLLSDGIHNAGGGSQNVLDAARVAKAMAAPIYTKTFGGEMTGVDLAVELRSPQDLAFVGQKVPVTVRIRHIGLPAGKTNVLLLHDGKEIARRDVELSPSGPADLHFMVSQEKVGVYAYEVRVEPMGMELTAANNSASYLLRVVDEPIRVLLLEGKPYWDSKFLLRTFASDPAVALDSVVRLTDQRLLRRSLSRAEAEAEAEATAPRPAATPTPTTRPRTENWKIINSAAEVLGSVEHLRGYQIVVLGRDSELFLTDSAIANLQNWIAHDGGSLVCYRGSPTAQVSQKLAKLMPVKWTTSSEKRFRVKLTDQGRDLRLSPGTDQPADEALAQLPTLASNLQVNQSKPLAVVLATAVGSVAGTEDAPAVVYQPYGTGKVVVIEGAGMWRWAFLPPKYQDHDQVYAGLWQSLLRWMTSNANLRPGQKMILSPDKICFGTTEQATATLLVRDEVDRKGQTKVELSTVGAKETTTFAPSPLGDDPGAFRLNFGKLPEGRYRAAIAGMPEDDPSGTVLFDVRSFGQEQLDLRARPDLMNRIASDSDGQMLGDNAVKQIAEQFRAHLAKTRPVQVERLAAWDRWWLLLATFGLWMSCWTVRRAGGLV